MRLLTAALLLTFHAFAHAQEDYSENCQRETAAAYDACRNNTDNARKANDETAAAGMLSAQGAGIQGQSATLSSVANSSVATTARARGECESARKHVKKVCGAAFERAQAKGDTKLQESINENFKKGTKAIDEVDQQNAEGGAGLKAASTGAGATGGASGADGD